MPSQPYHPAAVKKEIAAHSDYLLDIDSQLRQVIDRFEGKNRSPLVLRCNFILSQCETHLAALNDIHTLIQADPELRLSDLLLTQQSALYREYAAITRGLLETLRANQAAEQTVKETQRELEARLLQIRLDRKKVNHGQ